MFLSLLNTDNLFIYSSKFHIIFMLAWNWEFLWNGACWESSDRIVLANRTDSLAACQDLCIDNCRYISYATHGSNICFGHSTCEKGLDTIHKFETHKKKEGINWRLKTFIYLHFYKHFLPNEMLMKY